jgi:predicted TIM-barrel fold metal-dependent hydrolase
MTWPVSPERKTVIVDAHSHIFSLDLERYPLADPGSSYRPQTDGSAALLNKQMQEAGVDRAFTITVGFYGWDNRYALEQLAGNQTWLAVGVLVDPAGKDGPAKLEECVRQGACGLRIQRHLFYHQGLDDPISTPLWRQAAELDLTVDINATHEEYAAVEKRLREFPQTRFVLDHCGYVSGSLRPRENTVAPVVGLARYANAYAKLTFLSLASREEFPFRDVHWMVREIVDAFGPERCLFGSNFPTAQYSPRTTYAQLVELFAQAIDLSREERQWILGGTALRLWKWAEPLRRS